MGNFSREPISFFNGKSQVYNIQLISVKKKYRAQWEIPGLQYLASHNSRLNLREAGFNRKRRVARTHFNGKLQEMLDSMGKKGQPGTHFNRKFHIYNIWPTSMRVSWIQHVKNGNQDSFQWEITGWEKMQKKLNSMGKRGQPGAHFNRKLQVQEC